MRTVPAESRAPRPLIQVPAALEVPAPTATRIAELLGECSAQLGALLDEVPEELSLPERRRRALLVNRIRIILSSTGLLMTLGHVFDQPAERLGAQQ